MIYDIFNTVLIMSLIGSVSFFVLTVLNPLVKRLWSARYICISYCIILIFFLCPFSITYNRATVLENITKNINMEQGFEISRNILDEELIKTKNVVKTEGEIPTASTDKKADLDYLMKYVSQMWILIAVAMFAKKIVLYNFFRKKLTRKSKYLNKYMGIRVYSSSELTTPIALGLFRQRIFLPETVSGDTETKFILMHEYRHIRQGDIICKWVAMIAVCVHWFNPVIYRLSRAIDENCEYACDESVAKKMTKHQKKEYMNIILSMISKSSCQVLPLSTKMADEKKNIKNRFEIISSSCIFGRWRRILSFSFLCIFFALVFSACASFGGKLYGDRIPSFEFNMAKREKESSEKSIEKKKITQAEKGEPNIEYIISFPEYIGDKDTQSESEKLKEEISYDINLNSQDESNFEINDVNETAQEWGKSLVSQDDARVTIDEDSLYPGDLRGEMYLDNWSFDKMINDLEAGEYIQGSEKGTNLEKNYVVGTLTYETGNEAKVLNVKSDSRGHIEFYMDTDYEQFVEIGFEHEGKKIGGAGIVPGSEKLYYFGGFDPDKTYDITIKSSSGDTWQTTSKYVVY